MRRRAGLGVHEYVYWPRLAYLEWVQGKWVESSDTVEGRHAPRRVNRDGGGIAAARGGGQGRRLHARSITLSSHRLGLIARVDLDGGKGDAGRPQARQARMFERGDYDSERARLCVRDPPPVRAELRPPTA